MPDTVSSECKNLILKVQFLLLLFFILNWMSKTYQKLSIAFKITKLLNNEQKRNYFCQSISNLEILAVVGNFW